MAGEAQIDFGVAMPMRDGVILRADVFRPSTVDPVPVLLLRSPYPAQAARRALDHFRAVQAGFAVVAQSTRGTGDSEGEFEPWVAERDDGFDTIAWCASQPWSNGRVGMIGMSYLGHTQLFAASAAPEALVAMAPSVVPSSPYDLTYHGGVLLVGSALFWSMMQASMKTLRAMGQGVDVSTALGALMASASVHHDDLCRTAPLRDIALLSDQFPSWGEWLDHPSDDEWWHSLDVGDRPEIPALFITGWWDIFLRGTLTEFARNRHPRSRLVIGTSSHMIAGSAMGEVEFGMAAGPMGFDAEGAQLDFLGRYLLDGRPEPDGPPVRVFVMGSGAWRDFDSWPPSEAIPTRLYMRSDGLLVQSPPVGAQAPIEFDFDPLDPVPTLGGRNLLPGSEGGHRTGPWDHSRNDQRTDILRFVSAPLTEDLTVIGEISVLLHAATSAVDSDWTAMLLDVWPDGRAFNVADGIIRARYRSGTDRPILLPSGEPHDFEIDLVATAQVFKAGHRLRVDISSSNFPRFDRNPSTGQLSADVPESAFVSAHQQVFCDSMFPSYITLPIVNQ